jgi:hypothetical protein
MYKIKPFQEPVEYMNGHGHLVRAVADVLAEGYVTFIAPSKYDQMTDMVITQLPTWLAGRFESPPRQPVGMSMIKWHAHPLVRMTGWRVLHAYDLSHEIKVGQKIKLVGEEIAIQDSPNSSLMWRTPEMADLMRLPFDHPLRPLMRPEVVARESGGGKACHFLNYIAHFN